MTAKDGTSTFTEEDFDYGIDPFAEIDGEAEVTKYLYALRSIREKIEVHNTLLNLEIKHLTDWRTKKKAGLNSQEDFIRGKLHAFLELSNQKSIATPVGRIGYRKSSKFNWKNPQILIDKSDFLNIPTKTTVTPDKTAINDYIKDHPEAGQIFGDRITIEKFFTVKIDPRPKELDDTVPDGMGLDW